MDWHAEVWINGERVGEHHGGYDPFTFDITEQIDFTKDNEIVVAVDDPTDTGSQPRGKQVRKPQGDLVHADQWNLADNLVGAGGEFLRQRLKDRRPT